MKYLQYLDLLTAVLLYVSLVCGLYPRFGMDIAVPVGAAYFALYLLIARKL